MSIETTDNRTRVLEALLNDARSEADALRRTVARYERVLSSTRMLMGHELKKPTTALSGYLELVCDDLDRLGAPGTLEWAEKARRECRLLDDLMAFYLDLLKVEEDEPVAGTQAVDVKEIVEDTIADFPPRYNATSRVQLWVDPDVRPVGCNPEALRLIVTNLVENALIYSGAGHPVRLEVEGSVDKRGMSGRRLLKLRVIDEGIGVSNQDIQRVFNPFVRLRADVADGTGLGLTLVRSLVEMSGGSVHMNSGEGRGTTVHVTLPAPDPSGDDSVVMM